MTPPRPASRHVGSRAALALLRALGRLPLPWLRALGAGLGRLLFVLLSGRRKVALRNLELCFPGESPAQRRAWAKQSFVVFCQTFLDRGWLWSAPEAVVRSRVKLLGDTRVLEGDTPTIVFAPHFYSMDAGGLALPLHTAREFTSIFATNPNPVLDDWFMAGRQRFGTVRMLNRADGVKPILSCLRKGGLLYLLPDMDYGPRDSLFVPFFAVPDTATIPSLSRFAKLGRAQVVALYSRLTPQGYEAQLSPVWADFPSDDVHADTVRMNHELEQAIRTMPAQYYWVHKRFKTRPEGQPSLYK